VAKQQLGRSQGYRCHRVGRTYQHANREVLTEVTAAGTSAQVTYGKWRQAEASQVSGGKEGSGQSTADEVSVLLHRPGQHSEMHLPIPVHGHDPDHCPAEAVTRDQHRPWPHLNRITGIVQGGPAEPVIILSAEVSYQIDLRVVGLFIWARIGDQRQRSFVTGYPWPTARL
jgi:hypothetical protein